MDLNKSFAINLRRARRAASLSQNELADACHINASYLSQVENGKRNPTLSLVQRAARALHVSPVALLEDAANSPDASSRPKSQGASLDDYLLIFCTQKGMHVLPVRYDDKAAIRTLARLMVRGYTGENLCRRLLRAHAFSDNDETGGERDS